MTDAMPDRAGRRDVLQVGLKSLRDLAARTAGAYLAGYDEALPPPRRTRIRPPGALPEPAFARRCTACGDCISACPFDALGADERGLPWLGDPAGHPCYMCDGFPCIAACKPRALAFADRRLRSIGLAAIDPALCLVGRGEPCSACRDACRDARAIDLAGGLPSVAAEPCTGCAVCVGRCPPRAIRVEPRNHP